MTFKNVKYSNFGTILNFTLSFLFLHFALLDITK